MTKLNNEFNTALVLLPSIISLEYDLASDRSTVSGVLLPSIISLEYDVSSQFNNLVDGFVTINYFARI